MSDVDAELERLRRLVGPSEIGFGELRDDLIAASAETKLAALEVGRLRGELAEMSVQLARARQDQDVLQRRRDMGPISYLGDLAAEYWRASLRPALGSALRRLGVRRAT